MRIFNIFSNRHAPKVASQALSIEGVSPAPLTPEPDDAELAAQAVLELLTTKKRKTKNEESVVTASEGEKGSTYYHHLADRIREARRISTLRATRFVAFCEQELRKKLPAYGPGSLGLLEAELYKRIDIVDREGGELKRRWQHCLADVTVRLMGGAERVEEGNGK